MIFGLRHTLAVGFLMLAAAHSLAAPTTPRRASPMPFCATGGQTYIRDGEGKVSWRYAAGTRDGWVLPDGNILLAVSKSPAFPGGGVGGSFPRRQNPLRIQGEPVRGQHGPEAGEWPLFADRGRREAARAGGRQIGPHRRRSALEGANERSSLTNPDDAQARQRPLPRPSASGPRRS